MSAGPFNRRLGYLAAALFFAFFIVHAAPHRVHHAFEEDQPACLALWFAKNCPADPPAPITNHEFQHVTLDLTPRVDSWKILFPLTWISSRGPPAA